MCRESFIGVHPTTLNAISRRLGRGGRNGLHAEAILYYTTTQAAHITEGMNIALILISVDEKCFLKILINLNLLNSQSASVIVEIFYA